jgi:hypothetical protein
MASLIPIPSAGDMTCAASTMNSSQEWDQHLRRRDRAHRDRLHVWPRVDPVRHLGRSPCD